MLSSQRSAPLLELAKSRRVRNRGSSWMPLSWYGGGLHFLRAIELRVDLEEKRSVRILLVKFAEVERPVMHGKGWRAGFHEKSRLFVRLKRRLALWRDCEKVR